jgi:hypothetical protein
MSLPDSIKDALLNRADQRFFTVMHTLIYPGVLGSLMYAYPDNIVSGTTTYSLPTALVSLAFFFAFVMDYAHSVASPAKRKYSVTMFSLDVVIVLSLFCAGQKLLGTPFLAWASVPVLLGLGKVAAVLWECAAKTREDSARNTDVVAAIAYFLFALLGPGNECWPSRNASEAELCAGWSHWLAAVLLLDAFSYVIYRKLATANDSAA